jgi:lipocalin
MTVEISNQVRIQQYEGFWYTVEDTHLDAGCDGCTISYWEFVKDTGDKRVQHICMEQDEALAIADAIYKLFKKD